MRRRRILSWVVAALAALVAMACGVHHVNLNPTTMVPAAHGRATLGRDANGNTTVDLSVQHLARPTRLSPPYAAYVVWAQSDSEPPANKGELRVGDDLKGEIHFVTAAQHFDIFITAENNVRIQAPSGPEVLRATVNSM